MRPVRGGRRGSKRTHRIFPREARKPRKVCIAGAGGGPVFERVNGQRGIRGGRTRHPGPLHECQSYGPAVIHFAFFTSHLGVDSFVPGDETAFPCIMRVVAAVAHPDDIEFMMAGTLLRLKDAGWEVTMWNLLDGCCGTTTLDREEIVRVRWEEARHSAALLGGTAQPSLFSDLEVFYDKPSLARVCAALRDIRPDVVLTHSLQDYMEDHQNVARLIVSATFTRGMRNVSTNPQRPAYDAPVAVYHALPHGLRDAMRQPIIPDFCVDITDVLERKRAMLACHVSQKEWLDSSQGMDSYLDEMVHLSAEVGRLSGKFRYAEGWRRHSHLGFGPEDFDPVFETLCR